MALDGVAADGTGTAGHPPAGFTTRPCARRRSSSSTRAGVRYRKALGTLVTEAASGLVRPDESILPDPARPDACWCRCLAQRAPRTAQRAASGTAPGHEPTAVFDDLLTGGIIAGRIGELDAEDALWERFAAWIGLPSFCAMPRSPPRGPAPGRGVRRGELGAVRGVHGST